MGSSALPLICECLIIFYNLLFFCF